MYNIVVNFQIVLNSKQSVFLWKCNLLIIQLFSTNGIHQSKNHNDLKKLHQFYTNSFAFEPIPIRLKRNSEDTSCEIITHEKLNFMNKRNYI